MTRADLRPRLAVAAVAALGALGLAQRFVDDYRPPAAESRVAGELVVTHAGDRGAGSFREALFAAATTPGRVRIVVPPGTIRLASALPPVVNPAGVVIQAEGVVLDASAVGNATALDIAAPHSQVAGLAVRGAAAQAIVARAPGLTLTGVRLERCGVGVLASGSAEGLTIERSRFEDNGVGVRIEAPARSMAIRGNHFARQREAGVWMVRAADAAGAGPERIVVSANRFEGDRMAVVAGNMPVVVERNEVVGARETGLGVIGAGITVRLNHVRDGVGVGVVLQDAPGARVEGNDISRHQALGVLVRASPGATVHGNRVHGNGYGMAFVLGAGSPVTVSENSVLGQRHDGIVVIGDSPVIRRNQALDNGQAGLRILDFRPAGGAPIASRPFLEDNRSAGNRTADVARGDYLQAAAGRAR